MSSLRRSYYLTLMYLCNRVVARIPSHMVRLAFYRQCMRFEVGAQTAIFMEAWFDARGRLRIGDHSVINQRCRLDNRGGLEIGNNVSISAEVCILTADHDIQDPGFAGRERPVEVGDYVFIGTRAMILPGVRIGTGAVVAAGAVVTKSVAPYQIVAGVPASVIGQRSADLDYRLDYSPLFC